MTILQITNYTIKNNKIPESFNGYKIALLSDLHYNNKCILEEQIINSLEKMNPDIVIMSGDMIDKKSKNMLEFISFMSKISNKYKVYYTLGNHEKRFKYIKLKQFLLKLEEININKINCKEIIYKNNEEIVLYGIDHIFDMLQKHKLENKYLNVFKSKLGVIENNKFNILVIHDPANFEICEKLGLDLILSGHVHGGIVRFGKIGLLSNQKTLFPKYCVGKYTINLSDMIVSRGLGNSWLKLRIFNNPELVLIELEK
jgi:predicted MPP superfamily phosphohydrolase